MRVDRAEPNLLMGAQMKIEILGTGCTKCHTLEANAKAAADKLGLHYELKKVTDIKEFAKRGVMFTPALVVDGAVKVAGRVPTESELTSILATAAQAGGPPGASPSRP